MNENELDEPAFPVNDPAAGRVAHGMGLRDYMAAKAMLGFICEPVEGTQEALVFYMDSVDADKIAEASYAMADAMLRARINTST